MPIQNSNDDGSGRTHPRRTATDVKSTQNERRPALVSLGGELMAVPIPLERDEVIIGRALEADVRLNDSRASRLHARITSERDANSDATYYRITDLGSTNGTLVNGELIT
ncbi:MAG: FHA domain-containing protein, partial [Pyrinomonadaceae bacterium]